MYCHPKAKNKWAKSLRPSATSQQIHQAEIMRKAKEKKRLFQANQLPLFPWRDGSAVTPLIPPPGESATVRPTAFLER